MIPAIKANFFQGEIARASYEYQNEIDAGRKTMVGVNKYVIDEPVEIPILEMDPRGRGEAARAPGDPSRPTATPTAGRRPRKRTPSAAITSENIMPALIEAAHAYATLGEITERAARRLRGPGVQQRCLAAN